MGDSKSSPPRRFAVYAAVAAVLGVLTGVGTFTSSSLANEAARFVPIFAWAFGGWMLWLLLVPGVIIMARHFPIGRERPRRNVAIHALGAAVFVLLHEAVYLGFIIAIEPGIFTDPGLTRVIVARLGGYGTLGLVVYFAVLATEHLVESRERARRRELDTSRLEAELAEARLQSLATQLQPHFLFNTLNAATGLLRDGRSEDAANVLVELGGLLRESLDSLEHSVVTLERERNTLERYLAIQGVRFGDRIQVAVDLPENTLAALLPHFLLQPLVENAFQHGVGQTTARGEVTIQSRRHHDRLELEVRDTGPGFSPAAHDGTGLRNARARLQQLYGDDFTITCRSDEGGCVCVAMPFRTAGA